MSHRRGRGTGKSDHGAAILTSDQSPNEQPKQSSGGAEQLFNRMLGASKFDLKTYNEVEHDKNATGQAALVVVLVAIATGVGTIGISGPLGIIWGILLGLIGWAVFAGLVYWVGTNLLPKPETKADWGQVARGMAFAQSPGMLRVFAIVGAAVSALGSLILFIIFLWVIAASVIAVREALDYGTETEDTLRALAVVIIAYIPVIIITAVLTAIG